MSLRLQSATADIMPRTPKKSPFKWNEQASFKPISQSHVHGPVKLPEPHWDVCESHRGGWGPPRRSGRGRYCHARCEIDDARHHDSRARLGASGGNRDVITALAERQGD